MPPLGGISELSSGIGNRSSPFPLVLLKLRQLQAQAIEPLLALGQFHANGGGRPLAVTQLSLALLDLLLITLHRLLQPRRFLLQTAHLAFGAHRLARNILEFTFGRSLLGFQNGDFLGQLRQSALQRLRLRLLLSQAAVLTFVPLLQFTQRHLLLVAVFTPVA